MTLLRLALTTVVLLVFAGEAGAQSSRRWPLQITAQPMEEALRELCRQTDLRVTFEPHAPQRLSSPLTGKFTTAQALARLLAGTGFEYEFINATTVMIRPSQASPSVERDADAEQDADPSTIGTPEVLIAGTRTLNADIRRTPEDAQPYVVFEREQITRSQAPSLSDFLANHLTMNTAPLMPSSGNGIPAFASPVDLGGLGVHQTLILINGRRTAGYFTGGRMTQPDLSGIPVSAIERIEVLRGTASGIYGGSATGGVINVVLRSDFSGLELTADLERMAHSEVDATRLLLSYGLQSESGDASLSVHAAYGAREPVMMREMAVMERARLRAVRHWLDRLPPIGAETNIRSASGASLFGPGTPSIASVPAGHVGGGLDAFASQAGAYNLERADTAQAQGAHSGVLHGTTLRSITITGQSAITSHLSVYFDAAYSQTDARIAGSGLDSIGLRGVLISAAAPNNPFGQDILVTVPSSAADGTISDETVLHRAAFGSVFDLPRSWRAMLEFVRSGSQLQLQRPLADPALLDAIQDGTLDVLRNAALLNDLPGGGLELRTSPLRATSITFTGRMAGPVGKLPGGWITLAAVAERHEEQMGDGTGTEYLNSGKRTAFVAQSVLTEQTQIVKSAALALRVPVVSSLNAVPGIQVLEMEASIRADAYRTLAAPPRRLPNETPAALSYARSEFHATHPVLGIRYRPAVPVLVRASYGTGFLAPSVSQLTQPTEQMFPAGRFRDPRRSNEPSEALILRAGGNPELAPEHARSWSVGLVLTPARLPTLQMSIDYTQINKRGNIVDFGEAPFTDLKQYERQFPSRITRGAAREGDPFAVGPITHIDSTMLNIAENEIAIWNLGLTHSLLRDGIGRVEFSAFATWQPVFSARLDPSSAARNDVGVTAASPLPVRANANLDVHREHWSLGWTARYYSAYEVSRDPSIIGMQGSTRVADRTYHDVWARFHLQPPAAGVPRLRVTLGIRNVFDADPPFDAGAINSGFVSPFADTRPSTYYLTVSTDL
jgi:iron complex outermembrane recepter protein